MIEKIMIEIEIIEQLQPIVYTVEVDDHFWFCCWIKSQSLPLLLFVMQVTFQQEDPL